MISVLILTRNEQQDLPGCLASVAWCDDIHVFDSMSTDRTAEIGAELGATVTQRAFDGYASQRNAALSTLPFKHSWLLILDADERSTPALNREMGPAVLGAANAVAGFRMRRRDYLGRTWLKHAQMTTHYIRLVRVGRAIYRRDINEILEVEGEVLDLQSPLDHYPFSKGISHWIEKHNTYSTMEADLLASGSATHEASLRTALFDRDFSRKRAAQKAIFYRLPARPLIKWIYLMFVRGAILDGRAGIKYSTLMAMYEYMIDVKVGERRDRFTNSPVD